MRDEVERLDHHTFASVTRQFFPPLTSGFDRDVIGDVDFEKRGR